MLTVKGSVEAPRRLLVTLFQISVVGIIQELAIKEGTGGTITSGYPSSQAPRQDLTHAHSPVNRTFSDAPPGPEARRKLQQ